MRILLVLLLSAVAVGASSVHGGAQCGGITKGVDFPDNDFKTVWTDSLDECCHACQTNSECKVCPRSLSLKCQSSEYFCRLAGLLVVYNEYERSPSRLPPEKLHHDQSTGQLWARFGVPGRGAPSSAPSSRAYGLPPSARQAVLVRHDPAGGCTRQAARPGAECRRAGWHDAGRRTHGRLAVGWAIPTESHVQHKLTTPPPYAGQVDRLGVPAYHYGYEALHGLIAGCPFHDRCFTSFPCSSASAASFNRSLWHKTGSAQVRGPVAPTATHHHPPNEAVG